MRPSERRALEAEKRAQREAEYREKELRRQQEAAEKAAQKALKKQRQNQNTVQQPYQVPKESFDPNQYDFENKKRIIAPDTERFNEKATYRKFPERPIEVKGDGQHREGFFSKNARIIGLVIGLVLVITVFCPLGLDIYFTWQERQEDGVAVDGEKMMTVDLIFTIAELEEPLGWDNLKKFDCRSFSNDEVREYAIEGTNIVLRVERTGDNAYPDIVRLIHYTNGTYFSEVRGADTDKLAAFFEANGVDLDGDAEPSA